jgi:hypothetical protein
VLGRDLPSVAVRTPAVTAEVPGTDAGRTLARLTGAR